MASSRSLIIVFPAHAGMSRLDKKFEDFLGGFPRSRGDEPQGAQALGAAPKFSPLTRG